MVLLYAASLYSYAFEHRKNRQTAHSQLQIATGVSIYLRLSDR